MREDWLAPWITSAQRLSGCFLRRQSGPRFRPACRQSRVPVRASVPAQSATLAANPGHLFATRSRPIRLRSSGVVAFQSARAPARPASMPHSISLSTSYYKAWQIRGATFLRLGQVSRLHSRRVREARRSCLEFGRIGGTITTMMSRPKRNGPCGPLDLAFVTPELWMR